ncbi:hypothetical protein BC629DRAFT_1554270, partial [Irpex lacteus]
MILGELCNFAAYAFVEAIVVVSPSLLYMSSACLNYGCTPHTSLRTIPLCHRTLHCCLAPHPDRAERRNLGRSCLRTLTYIAPPPASL